MFGIILFVQISTTRFGPSRNCITNNEEHWILLIPVIRYRIELRRWGSEITARSGSSQQFQKLLEITRGHISGRIRVHIHIRNYCTYMLIEIYTDTYTLSRCYLWAVSKLNLIYKLFFCWNVYTSFVAPPCILKFRGSNRTCVCTNSMHACRKS